MADENFYRFGNSLYRFRYAIVIFWAILLVACLCIIINLKNPFKETGFKDPNSESAVTQDYINKKLGMGGDPFIVVYKSNKLKATDAKFKQEVKDSLKNLKNFPVKHQITYPEQSEKLVSEDKHTAYATILFKNKKPIDEEFIKSFRKALKDPPDLTMKIGGEQLFLEETRLQTHLDLYKSEYIATPVSIITLLIIFGSLVAASLPIFLSCIFGLIVVTILNALGSVLSLSVFTLNIALLLGFCLNIDYALFIIYRFRLELKKNDSVVDALANTVSTAGKAVFFSGLAVLISLSTLLFFPINIMFSVGMGGISAVAFSVLIATILLPAILGMLGHRVNAWTIPFLDFNTVKFWRWLATTVIRFKWICFVGILLVLLALAYPFLHVKPGISDVRILPRSLESRQVFDIFKKDFGEGKITPISVMVQTNKGKILTQNNINLIYDFSKKLKKDSRVADVSSIAYTKPLLTKQQYYMLYHADKKYQSDDVKKLLDTTTGKNFTVINVISKYSSNDDRSLKLISDIRKMNPGDKLTVKVTGASANNIDVLHSIFYLFIYAIIGIMILTYLVLLILFRSIFLPFKAIIMNILSLCASYGVLTLVFQEGYLHELLNFEPQGILDINLLIIIFCSLFGFSMDYEVFLLTRIKEEWEKTHDNIESTICGIEFSSKIITSAALIVIVICFSFMAADILIVKAFGLGIAVAIFVDAFLIRTVLVPATMSIVGKWNWYLPKWLDAILPKV